MDFFFTVTLLFYRCRPTVFCTCGGSKLNDRSWSDFLHFLMSFIKLLIFPCMKIVLLAVQICDKMNPLIWVTV